MKQPVSDNSNNNRPSIIFLFKPYLWATILLIALAIAASALGLFLPKIIAKSIDAYLANNFSLKAVCWEFGGISLAIYMATYLQNIVQTYTSEKVAFDLRTKLADKISKQNQIFIEKITPAKLLTNLTADVDSIKLFISLAISTIISSVIVIIGASILLLAIDWQLALAVLTIIPIIGLLFFTLFSRVKILFSKSREVIDWLNRVINESIFGSTLIRILNSEKTEFAKFSAANNQAKNIGLQILKIFASLIPMVNFIASLATLIILTLGGHFVITGSMTWGSFAAFNSYIALLIFPIIILGFMSNLIAQATASYARIQDILETPAEKINGTIKSAINGTIEFNDVSLCFKDKLIIKNASFKIPANSKTAIIGPTAAGKTQLLHLLIGLIKPNCGNITYDDHNIDDFDPISFHRQVALVFQDSVIFNLSLRENIAFAESIEPAAMANAIKTAELTDFIAGLPSGLETIVSERGASLSGGQKQRLMLARGLALNPNVLLLDDFTARVDQQTERKILENIEKNYPKLTLISVTQKISSIEAYDQIILIMEGEIIAIGTHAELLKNCPEYIQIFDSQKSTNQYE